MFKIKKKRPYEVTQDSEGHIEVKIAEYEERKRVRFDQSNLEDSAMIIQSSFRGSSILSSDRDDPIKNRHKIDLTMSSKIDKEEVKKLLVNLIADAVMATDEKNFPAGYDEFPRFGTSPVSSPSCTPRELLVRPQEPLIEIVIFFLHLKIFVACIALLFLIFFCIAKSICCRE